MLILVVHRREFRTADVVLELVIMEMVPRDAYAILACPVEYRSVQPDCNACRVEKLVISVPARVESGGGRNAIRAAECDLVQSDSDIGGEDHCTGGTSLVSEMREVGGRLVIHPHIGPLVLQGGAPRTIRPKPNAFRGAIQRHAIYRIGRLYTGVDFVDGRRVAEVGVDLVRIHQSRIRAAHSSGAWPAAGALTVALHVMVIVSIGIGCGFERPALAAGARLRVAII